MGYNKNRRLNYSFYEMKSEHSSHVCQWFFSVACYLWLIWRKTAVGPLCCKDRVALPGTVPRLWSSCWLHFHNTCSSGLSRPCSLTTPPLQHALEWPYLGLARAPTGSTGLRAADHTHTDLREDLFILIWFQLITRTTQGTFTIFDIFLFAFLPFLLCYSVSLPLSSCVYDGEVVPLLVPICIFQKGILLITTV